MDIQADKFLALTAMLAGFMPVNTLTRGPGDAASGTGETLADSGAGTIAVGPITPGGSDAKLEG
jgi:hypothetical protein